MTAELLCLGEPMWELNQHSTTEDGIPLYLDGLGGDASNAAIAAARAGASVGMLGAIGQDRPGQSFLDLWEREGVDAGAVLRSTEAPTGLYVVTHGEAGHDFTYYRAGSAASRYRPEDVPREAVAAAKILHLTGISLGISTVACDAALHAMALAREAGVKVSIDTNLRLRLWPLDRARAIIHGALAGADIALPSLDDATKLTGLEEPDAVADFYLRLCPLVVLKLGSEGSLVATPDGRTRVPPRKVKAVDATGAGDTFGGSFLARTLAGDDPVDAARYANAAAALATTGYGAVAPMPRREAVLRFLEEQPEG